MFLHSASISLTVRLLLSPSRHAQWDCAHLHPPNPSHAQRYRPQRVRLTVAAPLPPSFVEVCEQAAIPLALDDVLGGVWVDGSKALGLHADLDARAAETIEYLRGQWYWRGKVEW